LYSEQSRDKALETADYHHGDDRQCMNFYFVRVGRWCVGGVTNDSKYQKTRLTFFTPPTDHHHRRVQEQLSLVDHEIILLSCVCTISVAVTRFSCSFVAACFVSSRGGRHCVNLVAAKTSLCYRDTLSLPHISQTQALHKMDASSSRRRCFE
jgi:hypothetical protein